MARTEGAKNRTWREVRTDGRRLIEKSKYMEKIEKLKTKEKPESKKQK
jgi:hypothetical protein